MSDKTSPTQPRRLDSIDEWHEETDIAIVGFGGARRLRGYRGRRCGRASDNL